MTRARLLVAILLLAVLPATPARACGGAHIALTRAPDAVVQMGTNVVLSGFVFDERCVPAQRVPVTLRLTWPSAPGTDWEKMTRTDRRGRFLISARVSEPGVVMTLAAPLLDRQSGSVFGSVSRQVGPLLLSHQMNLTLAPRKLVPLPFVPLRLLTTEVLCRQSGATYTVETRPVGGHWQNPQFVRCQGRATVLTSVLAATPTAYVPWPAGRKNFEMRAVRMPGGPFEVPSVSPPLRLHLSR